MKYGITRVTVPGRRTVKKMLRRASMTQKSASSPSVHRPSVASCALPEQHAVVVPSHDRVEYRLFAADGKSREHQFSDRLVPVMALPRGEMPFEPVALGERPTDISAALLALEPFVAFDFDAQEVEHGVEFCLQSVPWARLVHDAIFRQQISTLRCYMSVKSCVMTQMRARPH